VDIQDIIDTLREIQNDIWGERLQDKGFYARLGTLRHALEQDNAPDEIKNS